MTPAVNIIAPLRYSFFRRIWLASLVSNMGQFVQIVGASWAMTELTRSADLVALVQTAAMLPIMLLALPAGALADSHDRRLVALLALCIAFAGAATLGILASFDAVRPWSLLGLSLAIGIGMALLGPSWQASVREQVPAAVLPAAIALRSVSFNVGRSIGPAIGGIVVVLGGAVAAFSTAALMYLPLMLALFLWRPAPRQSRGPTHGTTGAVRHLLRDATIRPLLIRAGLTGLAGSSVAALMPLTAKDLLGGDAQTYGVILATFGIGAVFGGSMIAGARDRFHGSVLAGISSIMFGLAGLVTAISGSTALTGLAMFVGGIAWMLLVVFFNISIQLNAAPEITGRAIGAFQVFISGGIAFGSWFWGLVAEIGSVGLALGLSGALMVLLPLSERWLPMPVRP